MKRIFGTLAALQLMFVASPVRAQPPAYQWTGCYLGGSVGGTWGKGDIDNTFAAPTSVGTNPKGFMGGGQFGCDQQLASNWLIGLQGEFNGSGARDDHTIFPPFPFESETQITKIDWFASAAARLGFASGPWLLYGKGGAAWVEDHLQNSGALSSSFYDFSARVTHAGWTVGAGVEYAFLPHWSAVFEYAYYDFGTKTVTLSGPTGSGGPISQDSRNMSFKQNFSVVKVGLNYRFSTVP